MQDFETIKGKPFKMKCKTCGEEVPTGIVNISSHWVSCSGKDFTDALMANPPKNLREVDALKERYL